MAPYTANNVARISTINHARDAKTRMNMLEVITEILPETAAFLGDLDRKVVDQDVLDNPTHYTAAEAFAVAYVGDFEYMLDMQAAVARWGGLSVPQARGVLNCMRAELNRGAKAQAAKVQKEVAFEEDPFALTPVRNGTYTVVLAGDDDYVTLRIRDSFRVQENPGEQQVELLTGSDNETSFTGLGFLECATFTPWKSRRNMISDRVAHAIKVLTVNSEDLDEYREAYALRSGRCAMCGKKLTVPASLNKGLGPDCAKKV